jgi:hypothetical protein
LAQARLPPLRQALLPIYRNYRDELGKSNRGEAIVSDRKWALPKWHTLRFLLALSHEQRVGEIWMFSGFGKGIQKKTVSTPFLVVAEITLRSRSRIAPGWPTRFGHVWSLSGVKPT